MSDIDKLLERARKVLPHGFTIKYMWSGSINDKRWYWHYDGYESRTDDTLEGIIRKAIETCEVRDGIY